MAVKALSTLVLVSVISTCFPSSALCDAISVAEAYLSDNAGDFGIPQDLEGIEVDTVIVGRGATHVTFRQELEGVPVYNVAINVSVNSSNAVSFVASNYIPDLGEVNTTPSISLASAQAYSDSAIGTSDSLMIEEGSLVIFRDDSGEDHLAYVIQAAGDSLEPHEVIIDAHDSEILRATSLVSYTTGYGYVFSPDPVTRSGNQSLDDSVTNLSRQFVALPHLVTPVGNELYRIEGDTAFFKVRSEDLPGWQGTSELTWTPVAKSDSLFDYGRQESLYCAVYECPPYVPKGPFEEVNAYYHLYHFHAFLRDTLGVKGLSRLLKFDVHNVIGPNGGVYAPGRNNTHEIRLDDGGPDGVDGGEDQDFIIHEFCHAIQREYKPQNLWHSAEILARVQEGHADYGAISYRRSLPSLNCGLTTFEDNLGNWYSQPDEFRRRLDDSYHYPEADSGLHEPGGVMWASTFMDIEEAIGREKAMTAITESFGYLIPGATSQLVVHAVMQAYIDNFPDDIEYVGQIVRVFADRGFVPTIVGEIEESTSWLGSQYIAGDVIVNSGATLAIANFTVSSGQNVLFQGGTVIAFADSSDSASGGFDSALSELIVMGECDVQGTENRPIYFVGAGKPPTPPNESDCFFIHHPATEGRWWGIYFSHIGPGPRGTINHAQVLNSQWGLVIGSSQEVNVSNCSFANNQLTDIKSGTSSTGLEVRDCEIDIGSGIGMDLGAARLVFQNELVGSEDSERGIVCSPSNGSSDSTKIVANSISNIDHGIGVELGRDSLAVLTQNQITACEVGISIKRGKHLVGTEDEASVNELTGNTTCIEASRSGPTGCPASVFMEAHVRNTTFENYTVGVRTVKVASDSVALAELGTEAYSSGHVPGEGRNRFLGPDAITSIGNSSSCGTVFARGNYFGPGAGALAGNVDTTGTAPTDTLSTKIPVEAVPSTKQLVLLGVSPNPISQSADVIFEVGRDRVGISVSIYDVAGRLVRSLGEKVYDEGRHSILWDAKDESGRLVPNGLFFLRLTTSGKAPLQSRIVVLQ